MSSGSDITHIVGDGDPDLVAGSAFNLDPIITVVGADDGFQVVERTVEDGSDIVGLNE